MTSILRTSKRCWRINLLRFIPLLQSPMALATTLPDNSEDLSRVCSAIWNVRFDQGASKEDLDTRIEQMSELVNRLMNHEAEAEECRKEAASEMEILVAKHNEIKQDYMTVARQINEFERLTLCPRKAERVQILKLIRKHKLLAKTGAKIEKRIFELERLQDRVRTYPMQSLVDLEVESFDADLEAKKRERAKQAAKMAELKSACQEEGESLTEQDDTELESTVLEALVKATEKRLALAAQNSAKAPPRKAAPIPWNRALQSFDPKSFAEGEVIVLGERDYYVSHGKMGTSSSFFLLAAVEGAESLAEVPHFTLSYKDWLNSRIFHLSNDLRHHYFKLEADEANAKFKPLFLKSTLYTPFPSPGERHNTPCQERVPLELLPLASDFAKFINAKLEVAPKILEKN